MENNTPKEYKDYRDPVSEFIEKYCVKATYAKAPLCEFYDVFKKSELENGHIPMSKIAFSRIMQDRGHGKDWSPIKGDGRVYIRGFYLKEGQE